MSKNTPDGNESIEPRTRRALTEPLSVLTLDGMPVHDDDETIVQVVSHSGESYRVDAREGRCTCPDAEYNLAPGETCKHARRARAALGTEPVDSQVLDALDVDENLGANAPGPVVATPDGGIIEAGDEGVILEDRPPITEHRESYEQGGARFWRCEGCGRETVHGRENIPHADGCARGDD
jgi:hypothetical protein